MLSKTSIQAVYINRVKERVKLIAEYDNLISRKAVDLLKAVQNIA